MVPLSLEVIDIIFCFKFEGCTAPTPLSGLAIIGRPISFTALSTSSSVLMTAPGTTGTPAFGRVFHFRLKFSLLKIFWLSTKNIELFTKSKDPIPTSIRYEIRFGQLVRVYRKERLPHV